jgi:hypothetical protein
MVVDLILVYFIIGFFIANVATLYGCKSELFNVQNGTDFWMLMTLWPVVLVLPCIIGICSLPIWLLNKWVKILRS